VQQRISINSNSALFYRCSEFSFLASLTTRVYGNTALELDSGLVVLLQRNWPRCLETVAFAARVSETSRRFIVALAFLVDCVFPYARDADAVDYLHVRVRVRSASVDASAAAIPPPETREKDRRSLICQRVPPDRPACLTLKDRMRYARLSRTLSRYSRESNPAERSRRRRRPLAPARARSDGEKPRRLWDPLTRALAGIIARLFAPSLCRLYAGRDARRKGKRP